MMNHPKEEGVGERGRVLCSPFTNPLKRKKLLNVKVFESFREVDPAKVSDLTKWLEKSSPR